MLADEERGMTSDMEHGGETHEEQPQVNNNRRKEGIQHHEVSDVYHLHVSENSS